MPLPSGSQVFIEWVSGTWTDVTADVDYQVGVTVQQARAVNTPQPSQLTLTLRDPLGKYVPGVQVLADGTTSPNYPNVVPRKRIQYVRNGGVRFLGTINSFAPVRVNGVLSAVQVSATDVTDRMSRQKLSASVIQEVTADGPVGFWPMTDSSGSGSATAAGSSSVTMPDLAVTATSYGTGTASFGATSVYGIESTGMQISPDSGGAAPYLVGEPTGVTLGAFTVELWAKCTSATLASSGVLIYLLNRWADATAPTAIMEISNTTGQAFFGSSAGNTTVGPDLRDNTFHHFVLTVDGTGNQRQYIDGAAVGSVVFGPTVSFPLGTIWVGGLGGLLAFNGTIGPVAIYNIALSPTRIATHYQAGQAFVGETVDQRISRLLGYAGLSSGGTAGFSLDVSQQVLNGYPQSGKDIMTAIGEAVASEGGGAVFYSLDGQLTFRNRDYRTLQTTPILTVDADADLDRGTWAPLIDSSTLVNQATVSRQGAAGQIDDYTASNTSSINTYGLFAASAQTWGRKAAFDENPGARLAEQIVADNSTPALRLPQIGVDLLTASHNLYTSAQSVQIGSRIRVTNLPQPTAATQQDFTAEGWFEVEALGQCMIVFDVSAADNPARGVYDTSRYAADSLTLAANALATDLTLSVTVPAGKPGFTLTSGSWPFDIRIGAEVLTVTAVSGTSTQTLTVTRATQGTKAAAHAAGSYLTLAPTPTYTL